MNDTCTGYQLKRCTCALLPVTCSDVDNSASDAYWRQQWKDLRFELSGHDQVGPGPGKSGRAPDVGRVANTDREGLGQVLVPFFFFYARSENIGVLQRKKQKLFVWCVGSNVDECFTGKGRTRNRFPINWTFLTGFQPSSKNSKDKNLHATCFSTWILII